MSALKPLPNIDPNRLNLVVGAFNVAFQGVPQEMDLLTRARMALDACPQEIVRELGEAVDAFAGLVHERLGDVSA